MREGKRCIHSVISDTTFVITGFKHGMCCSLTLPYMCKSQWCYGKQEWGCNGLDLKLKDHVSFHQPVKDFLFTAHIRLTCSLPSNRICMWYCSRNSVLQRTTSSLHQRLQTPYTQHGSSAGCRWCCSTTTHGHATWHQQTFCAQTNRK